MKQAVFWSYNGGRGEPTRYATAFIQHGWLVAGEGGESTVQWLNSGRVKVMDAEREYTPADGDLYLEKLHLLFHGQGGYVTVEDAP